MTETCWTFDAAALDAIEAHARADRPRECCGLLIGRPGHVREARPAANLSPDPNRFLLDSATHIAALRDVRTRGLRVVGFYHSHPHSPAVPSPTDLADGAYPDLLHAIVSLAADVADTRAYYLLGDHYREVPLARAGALPRAAGRVGDGSV